MGCGGGVACSGGADRVKPEALARDLDERCHGVRGDAVRAGVVGAGPVLRLLRSYPECVGLVFGATGEASPSVHELCAHVAKVWALSRDGGGWVRAPRLRRTASSSVDCGAHGVLRRFVRPPTFASVV